MGFGLGFWWGWSWLVFVLFCFETRSHYVDQAGLEIIQSPAFLCLPLPPPLAKDLFITIISVAQLDVLIKVISARNGGAYF